MPSFKLYLWRTSSVDLFGNSHYFSTLRMYFYRIVRWIDSSRLKTFQHCGTVWLHTCNFAICCGNTSVSRNKKERDTDRNKEKEQLEACANSVLKNTNCQANKNTVRDYQCAINFLFSWFLQSWLSPCLFHIPTAIWYFVQAFEVGSRGRGSSQSLSVPLCDQ